VIFHFWRSVPGWFDFEAVYERAVREAPAGGVLVEVGSWKGQSMAHLAVEAANSGKDLVLYAVDTFRGSKEAVHQQDKVILDHGTVLHEFCRNLLPVLSTVHVLAVPSVLAARVFDAGSVDFVFIDGSHDEVDVRADLSAWWPTLKTGGVMAGHDFYLSGVANAVYAFVDQMRVPLTNTGSCWRLVKP